MAYQCVQRLAFKADFLRPGLELLFALTVWPQLARKPTLIVCDRDGQLRLSAVRQRPHTAHSRTVTKQQPPSHAPVPEAT